MLLQSASHEKNPRGCKMQNILQPLVFRFPSCIKPPQGAPSFIKKGSALFFHASSGGSGAAYCSGLLFSCSFTKLLICSNA